MSTIRHHPRPETLADFAAGRLDEARAVVIAAHAAVCERCALAVADYEAAGGACLEACDPVAMAPDALEKILARTGENVVLPEPPANPLGPLGAYLDGDIDDINWRPLAPGVAQHVLAADGYRSGALRLFRIAPGMRMFTHTHKGNELTFILRGAYEDELSHFGPGDLADLDGEHTHAPKAVGDEPCICLIATAAPLSFKNVIGKIVQPFIGL